MNKEELIEDFNKNKLKRISLPFLFGLWILLLPKYKIVHPSFVISLMSFILFLNFPIIVTFSNTKPLYYEDLFLNTSLLPRLEITEQSKESFKKIFTFVLVFTNSILTGLLYDYWIIKTKNTSSIVEIIGISGGILKIFQVINHSIGIITLKIIKYTIKTKISNMEYENEINDQQF
ncbi:MAG: hypothetical protein CMF80_08215 [Candidatus Marinimicrobia bacterium]|nr:hypothetical protein [Candidatus Neomarinimicrobiota bacterium]|tara:strand:+ start:448 stop:975 length:528 start_codon:yes stop_codon:yes gene_type:complete